MATTADDALFVDTNVLVYADLTSAPMHGTARQRLVEAHASGQALWISRQVIREYLVVLTRGQVFSSPVPASEAAVSAEKIMGQMNIANDTANTSEQLFTLIKKFDVKGKQVHDANIVATMPVHGIKRLLTHNTADFQRYRGLIGIVPLV